MIRYLTRDLLFHLIIFQGLILSISLWNIYLTRKARQHPNPEEMLPVSILVPARNEELNIQDCISSLLAQNYPDFEIIVLDDRSDDRTWQILNDLAPGHPNLTVLKGSQGPQHQPGKNWACTQLAQAAAGELLLFTDADTHHHPDSLTNLVRALIGENADLLSGYPRQELGTWGEKLLVPFFSWAVMTFFPLGVAYLLPWPIFTTAVGQLMLFRKEAYQAIGGHQAVGSSIVDDLSLARNVHRRGLRWRVIQIADLISCRMYRSSQEALSGFTKNLFAAFQFRLLPFIFAFSWLGILYLLPLLVSILWLLGWAPQAEPWTLGTSIILALATWLIPYLQLGIPGWLALGYPVTVIANIYSALRSLWLSTRGELNWKDRSIQPDNWKWL